MQESFDFGAGGDLLWVRDRLRACFGRVGSVPLRPPVGQLVKSSISGRTRDEISAAAYQRLVDAYPAWTDITNAVIAELEAVIRDVTFPDVKARHLRDALREIAACRPDFDLAFLRSLGVARALAWLERLPGVGRKVSASTLNFSVLHMPAFVIDTHVLRIVRRFGFVRRKADARTAYEAMMAMANGWTATDLAELHILMKHLGQTVCRADRADCGGCGLGGRCRMSAALPPAPAQFTRCTPSL